MVGRNSSVADTIAAGVAAVVAGALILHGPGDGGKVPGGIGGDPEKEAAVPPVHVVVGKYVNAPVVPMAARLDGALDIPKPAGRTGWWALGAAPGAASGTVLIAGHVDSAHHGRGAFAPLWDVPLRTKVTVTSGDGRRYTYRLTARRTYRGTALPDDLFGNSSGRRIALVTCIGSYDRAKHRYSDNLVLYGVPVG